MAYITTNNNATHTLIHGWTSTPIHNFSLSAAGLLVLADLNTIAQRTSLRGGSSWLDSLLLAPGLHYQQAADELAHGDSKILSAVEIRPDGKPVSHQIVNQAVVNYVLRTAKEGETVVLDVGEIPVKSRSWRTGRNGRGGQRASVYAGGWGGGGRVDLPDLGWTAHLLYLASPLLTCVAIVLIILVGDWWALAMMGALMLSRILNIFVIKQRSRPKPKILPPPFSQPPAFAPEVAHITQYTININPVTTVILRGLSTDLQALTTTVWLRPKTHAEGYLEAIAKVLVYLVAACSGNATQAGNLVLLVLLLVSGGLLALSNAQVRGLRSGGRVVAPSPEDRHTRHRNSGSVWSSESSRSSGGGGRVVHNGGGHRSRARRRETTESWPESSDLSSLKSSEDSLEKGEAGRGFRRSSTDDGSLDYRVQFDTRLGKLEVVALRNR
ncbi:hypothetical protein J7T55_012040 [Diaporthe amygdali]|uniref:uncharacterized protein n=1 Tax=Phomopsis amygdali TaxID=1214568 RepID=UPI0022FED639|nr:uncharacterized protein J7T55_012040 [Diaporthe amygdali]KAJ0123575.1 hypothetical protein J7T55_012040 [Diaporthe amygdali]